MKVKFSPSEATIEQDLKNSFFKRKKEKKESIIIRRRGWLQRSNAINEGFVCGLVFMAEFLCSQIEGIVLAA